MSHYILKLTSGEFVYGVIDKETQDDLEMVVVSNPMTWEEYEMADGHTGTALVKYMNGTAETNIPIATSSITSVALMSEVFENFYEAAVACQKITDEAYDEKIVYMTSRMVGMVMEYQAKAAAEELGKDSLVAYKKHDTDITFH